jgi:hypothetical protein
VSQNLFNTRFRDLRIQGEMIPIDFESLRTDQKYLYFIRSQKHLIGWLIEETKLKVIGLSKRLGTRN